MCAMKPGTARAVALLLAFTVTSATAVQQKPNTRRVYMSVVDATNQPVLDLTRADFQIKENGAPATEIGRASCRERV